MGLPPVEYCCVGESRLTEKLKAQWGPCGGLTKACYDPCE